MDMIESELEQASRTVACALVKTGGMLTDLYWSIRLLTYERTRSMEPLVFWAKWHTSPGLAVEHSGTPRERFTEYRTNEAGGRDVIFAQAPNGAVGDRHDHLLEGVQKARAACAKSVGLITNQRFFTDEQLMAMKPLIDWVLVPDALRDQFSRFDRLAPGIFFSFPYARSHELYPHVLIEEAPIMHPRQEGRQLQLF